MLQKPQFLIDYENSQVINPATDKHYKTIQDFEQPTQTKETTFQIAVEIGGIIILLVLLIFFRQKIKKIWQWSIASPKLTSWRYFKFIAAREWIILFSLIFIGGILGLISVLLDASGDLTNSLIGMCTGFLIYFPFILIRSIAWAIITVKSSNKKT